MKTAQSVGEIIKILNTFNVEKAVVIPFPSPRMANEEDEFWYHYENDLTLCACEEYKNRLYPALAFHPYDKRNIEFLIRMIKEGKVIGLKFHPRAIQIPYEALISNPVLEIASEYDIPIILHIGSGREEEFRRRGMDISLRSALYVSEAHRDNIFIFTHLGRLHRCLEDALRADNVYVDTSALTLKGIWNGFVAIDAWAEIVDLSPREIIEFLVDLGFQDKLLWGSDMPFCLSYEAELSYVLDANIDERSKRRILYENARKIFGI